MLFFVSFVTFAVQNVCPSYGRRIGRSRDSYFTTKDTKDTKDTKNSN